MHFKLGNPIMLKLAKAICHRTHRTYISIVTFLSHFHCGFPILSKHYTEQEEVFITITNQTNTIVCLPVSHSIFI